MIKALLILSPDALQLAYAEPVLQRLRSRADLIGIITPSESWREHRDLLAQAQVILSGWGAPLVNEEFLHAAPNLRAIFYAGGSVRYFATAAMWNRGIRVSTAQEINAIPVSEFTAAAILLSLKRFWHYGRQTRELRSFPTDRPLPGAYRSTVGLISYGIIARQTRHRLLSTDVEVIVYDPHLSEEDARQEKIRCVDLKTLFAMADVVSLHTPSLPETKGMIGRQQFENMKPGATFINTARGEIVVESEMIAVLQARPDLQALLDVTSPEPPAADSPLYDLPNVVLTPHIAGSVAAECQRLGHAMVDELERFYAGQPLRWELSSTRAERTA